MIKGSLTSGISSKYDGLSILAKSRSTPPTVLAVLLESLSLKKFVISSNCPTGPKEILLNGKGGLLFDVENHKQLAKKILFYKNNKVLCKKKLNYAVKKITRFDFKKNLIKYHQVIDKLQNC